MNNLLRVILLAAYISCGSGAAFAADTSPTVSDAHAFIGYLIEEGAVALMLGDDYPHVFNYRGDGCASSFNLDGRKYEVFVHIHWADISSVGDNEPADPPDIHLRGVIHLTFDGDKRTSYGISFRTPDEQTKKRLARALTLLVNACAKKSKFD